MQEKESSARSDMLGGLAWLALGVLILVESLRMERFTKMGATLYTMPGFTPGILGAIIAVLGIVLSLRGWKKQRSQRPASSAPEGAEPLLTERLLNQRLLIALPLCLVYAAALLGRVPFWLATALFLGAFTYLFAPQDQPLVRRLVQALLSAVISTAIVISVFQYVFLVRLP